LAQTAILGANCFDLYGSDVFRFSLELFRLLTSNIGVRMGGVSGELNSRGS
jgi:hypothetical protein